MAASPVATRAYQGASIVLRDDRFKGRFATQVSQLGGFRGLVETWLRPVSCTGMRNAPASSAASAFASQSKVLLGPPVERLE